MLTFYNKKFLKRVIGRNRKKYHSVTSTNDVAFELASIGPFSEGTVIIALKQTAGRGRTGRSWMSEFNQGLYMSIVLYPNIKHITRISIAVAVSIKKVFQKLYNLEALIKWPNDILIDGKKVAGILIETKMINNRLCLVIGIGINTNWKKDDCIGDFRREPTALNLETSNRINKKSLIKKIINELNYMYNRIDEDWNNIKSLAEKNLYGLEQEVKVVNSVDNIIGRIYGLSLNGELAITTKEGNNIIVNSGEVEFVNWD